MSRLTYAMLLLETFMLGLAFGIRWEQTAAINRELRRALSDMIHAA